MLTSFLNSAPVSTPSASLYRSSRLWVAALAVAALTGCASQAPTDEGGRQAGQWERQQADVEAFESWTLVGKAGLRTPEENTSANLDWNQTPYYFRMLISGPFGGGRSVLEGREGRFSLTTSEGRFEAETPEALWKLTNSASRATFNKTAGKLTTVTGSRLKVCGYRAAWS